jgi:hypothetical protein
MPFPPNLEELQFAKYVYARSEQCPVCREDVEIFITPGKREIIMNPMHRWDAPAIRHYETCNIAQPEEANGSPRSNVQNAAGRDSDSGDGCDARRTSAGNRASGPDGEKIVPLGRCDAQSERIRLYAVTDKNMLAVGWLGGILEVAFRHGQYQYANVPEEIFVTLRKVPYPNNYFTKVVKSHPELYPFTKVA